MNNIEIYTPQMNIKYEIRNWFIDNYDIKKLAYFLSTLSLEGAMNLQERASKWFTLNDYYKDGDTVSFSFQKGNTFYYSTYECSLNGYTGEVWETSFDEFQKEPEQYLFDTSTNTWYSELETTNILYSFDGYEGPSTIRWTLTNSSVYPHV